MSLTRVTESRPYDARYDPSYTGPFHNNASMDPRVKAAISKPEMVAGAPRYKYFRRPIMPRMSAVPPNILLAPTNDNNPMVPVEEVAELLVKTVEVQTMYRESEAQTNPYTPDYIIAEGHDPEVLLIKHMNYTDGTLPLGKKEVEMVEHARRKKDLDSNLPPFTDEASLGLRKRLMEQQELNEFNLREMEIDKRRERRLEELKQALDDREESAELLASQRIEAIRQIRMDQREKVLTKIRAKRIKVLRQLALKRNQVNPNLSVSGHHDIINDYFDKGSTLYAPIARDGTTLRANPSNNDVVARTAPLDTMENITSLEDVIPNRVLKRNDYSMSLRNEFSKTTPAGLLGLNINKGGGRAAEHRDTSATLRAMRNTKRDLEEMNQIIVKKKKEEALRTTTRGRSGPGSPDSLRSAPPGTGHSENRRISTATTSPGSPSNLKRIKGRPMSPDLTIDERGAPLVDNHTIVSSCLLLQRLLRGRAVQNVMYEGRLRRARLIAELREADELLANEVPEAATELNSRLKEERKEKLRVTTIEAVAGGGTASVLYLLAQEQQRAEVFEEMIVKAQEEHEIRRKREAFESGRRQKENMNYPSRKLNEAERSAQIQNNNNNNESSELVDNENNNEDGQ